MSERTHPLGKEFSEVHSKSIEQQLYEAYCKADTKYPHIEWASLDIVEQEAWHVVFMKVLELIKE